MKHRYTCGEIEWLRSNIQSHSYSELAQVFREYFGVSVTDSAILHICLKNGITHGRKGEIGFVKGQHNAFSAVNPIGHECTDSRGRVWVKVSDNVTQGGNWLTNYRQKNRVVYEQHRGTIPKGFLVVHLDGNKQNCSIENLCIIDRKTNMLMNNNKWFSTNANVTLTAIMWCKLYFALKQSRKECKS